MMGGDVIMSLAACVLTGMAVIERKKYSWDFIGDI